MFPAKFGMKSTRDGNRRRRCRDRRVLVIPSLSLMDMFSPAKVIAAMKTVRVGVCVAGIRTTDKQESICSAPSFLLGGRRPVPVKRCINTETTDRRSEHYGCSLPGRPSHLPHSHWPASGTRHRF